MSQQGTHRLQTENRLGAVGRTAATSGLAAASGLRTAAESKVRMAASTVGNHTVPWQRWVIGISLVVPLVLVFVACGSPDPAPTSVRVARASVSSKVTGTGALRAITEQNLGFNKGGQLKELNVAVGQQVQAGQVLARIDDFEAKADLKKANAELAREQAALERIRDANKLDATSDDADSAKEVLEATEKQADEVDEANARSIEQAERQVTAARVNFARAQAANEADEVRCQKSVGGDSRRKPGEVQQEGGLRGELNVPRPVESAACDRARRSAVAVAEARANGREAQTELEQARQKRQVDKAQQQVAIQNARREAKAAENEAEGVENDRPHDLDEQEAVVSAAEAEVSVAAREVENTVLRAPLAGKIAAINGAEGEYLGGGSPTTPLSPGGRTPLPDVADGASASTSSSNSKADRPGGSAFMVIDDVNTFQVVVPFEESDAARVEPNQRVDVTFDSVPDLTRQGTVVAVAPTGTSIQDVTNYYVTIVLNEVDPRLKDGQTAQADVIVGQLDDVLVVPNGALQQGGKTGVVTVLEPNGAQRQVQVQLGLAGDGVTQVISGLKEGQRVVVAQS